MRKPERVGVKGRKYGFYRVTKNGDDEFVPLGNTVHINRILRNIETDTYKLELEYEYAEKTHKLLISRGELVDKQLLKYAKNGMDVFDNSLECLVELLRQKEKVLLRRKEIANCHSTLGWKNFVIGDERKRLFLHSFCEEISSEYDGSLRIIPRGTFKDWKKDVESLMLGNIPMETILVIALSAVVFGYLRGELDFTNPVVHICGDSSSGKTTALMAGIATAGNPSTQVDGLSKTWRGTSNALIGALKGIQGVPIGRDELSMYGGNLSELIYQISLGREKDRLDKDLKLVTSEAFTTVLISTGETGMLSKCSGNTGLNLRVIELKADKWTVSAENSEKIKRACQKHYGTACVELAKELRTIDKSELLCRVEELRTIYIERSKVKSFQERSSMIYAIILLTAEIMKERLEVEFCTEDILRFLIENEAESAMDFDRDLGYRFYYKFMEYVWVNRGNFIEEFAYAKSKMIKSEQKNTLLRKWGVIKDCSRLEKIVADKKVMYEVSIRKNQFSEVVRELGFEDSKNILKNLKGKKLLNCDGDRYTVVQQIKRCFNRHIILSCFQSFA